MSVRILESRKRKECWVWWHADEKYAIWNTGHLRKAAPLIPPEGCGKDGEWVLMVEAPKRRGRANP